MNRLRNRNKPTGFTLIELLIVIAIIGIVAAILIPNLLDSLHKGKQKRTMGDMKAVGTCWFSWITDQAGAAAAGSSPRTYQIDHSVQLDASDLLSTLYIDSDFFYCREVPEQDGWGTDYRFHYAGDPLRRKVIAIRSAGRDRTFDGDSYDIGPYMVTNYGKDIVWADGFFISYPAGRQVNGG